MSHWAVKYLRGKWTDDTDCLYWFRYISKEEFGIDVPDCKAIDHSRLVRSAAKVMTGDILEMFGYAPTEKPKEGDAVFLTQRNRPHHLGMVILVNGRMQVLHALEGVGMVVSDIMDLSMNGWKIESYWSYAS